MARKRKESRPYVMRGVARPSAARPTVLDPPDGRMAQNPVPKISAERLRALPIEYVTDPRLRIVDRYFRRWAVTHGDSDMDIPGITQQQPLYLRSYAKPSQLEKAESLIMDASVRTAPGWARQFVSLWYRAELTATEIQEKLAIKRRQSVYEERNKVLFYFLGRLIEAGLRMPSLPDVSGG